MIELTHEQEQALDASGQAPAKMPDRVTGQMEVLLRADDFVDSKGTPTGKTCVISETLPVQ